MMPFLPDARYCKMGGVLLCTAALALAGCGGPVASPRVPKPDGTAADAQPPEQPAEGETVPLVGFRELDPTLLMIDPGDDAQQATAGLPVELFMKAARTSKPVLLALKQNGKDSETASFEDMFAAARSVAASTGWNKKTGEASQPISFKLPGSDKTAYADSNFLIGLTTSELFGAKARRTATIADFGAEDYKVAAFQLDPATAASFKLAYEKLGSDDLNGLSNWTGGIGYCVGHLTQSPLLSKNARVEMGAISFGKPRAVSAAEKHIRIADSQGESDPIYWLDLFVTVRNLNAEEIEDLTIRVKIAPAECIALALLPDYHEKVGFQESPDSGLTAFLDQHIQQEPRYKKLKPNITAGGLRESEPYWKMSAGALAETLYLFTAIVRIPAESETIDVVLSAEGRLQKHFLVRKDVIATERPVTLRVTLPPVHN